MGLQKRSESNSKLCKIALGSPVEPLLKRIKPGLFSDKNSLINALLSLFCEFCSNLNSFPFCKHLADTQATSFLSFFSCSEAFEIGTIIFLLSISEKNKAIAKDLSSVADVKHSPNSKARFAVVDNKDVVFMLMDDQEVHPTYDTGIWVKAPFFANALNGLFDVAWGNMKKP